MRSRRVVLHAQMQRRCRWKNQFKNKPQADEQKQQSERTNKRNVKIEWRKSYLCIGCWASHLGRNAAERKSTDIPMPPIHITSRTRLIVFAVYIFADDVILFRLSASATRVCTALLRHVHGVHFNLISNPIISTGEPWTPNRLVLRTVLWLSRWTITWIYSSLLKLCTKWNFRLVFVHLLYDVLRDAAAVAIVAAYATSVMAAPPPVCRPCTVLFMYLVSVPTESHSKPQMDYALKWC